MSDQSANGPDRFIEAQKLHQHGLDRCHGPCKQILPTESMLSVIFQNTLATSICVDCFENVDLRVSMKFDGLNIQLLQKTPIILTTR